MSHLLQMRGLKPIQNQPKKNWKQSHLLQMRGLKLYSTSPTPVEDEVASFTDAWIETNMSIEFNDGLESHLLQMRGLKRLPLTLDARTLKSHLLQMRGLKLSKMRPS